MTHRVQLQLAYDTCVDRRHFLKTTALALTGSATATPPRPVVIFTDPDDRVASSRPAQWAIAELLKAINGRPQPDVSTIVAKGAPSVAEASSIVPALQTLTVTGNDPRGLTYALLELADQVTHTGSLARGAPLEEQPANRIRSIIRPFVSEVEDKAWFYDRDA